MKPARSAARFVWHRIPSAWRAALLAARSRRNGNWRSMANNPLTPVVVWAVARKPESRS